MRDIRITKTAPEKRRLQAMARVFAGALMIAALAGLIYIQIDELIAATRNPRWAKPISLPDSKNFYQVSDDLYRSAQPSAAAFKAYEELGIKTVLCLRNAEKDKKLMKGTGLDLKSVPMIAGNITDEHIIQALRFIHESPKPVLVHCYRGADRAGAVTAAYRVVFEGWSKEDAVDELINGGYRFDENKKNIPEYIRAMDVEKIRSAVLFPELP